MIDKLSNISKSSNKYLPDEQINFLELTEDILIYLQIR